MNIGHVTLDLSIYDPAQDIYSDGPVEDEMLAIAQEDREADALANDNRWPILYHFSPLRHNLLSWYPFHEGASLLEVGSGCGAMTGVFLDQGLNVRCIESSKRRATIAAHRHQAHDLAITIGDVLRVPGEASYDYLTLIGVLEYAPMFLPQAEHPFHDMLRHMRQFLRPGGTLVIAIENRLGMKYFTGAGEDHTSKPYEGLIGYPHTTHAATFSHSELAALLRSAGFSHLDWYYPYPDYKLPEQIYSDAFLPAPENLVADICAYDADRIMTFDERAAMQTVAGKDEFRMLANSFLVFCRKEDAPHDRED